ncbi:DNA-binding transcriptional regulator, MocR family, contains an aminotransferase domain [Gordonia malaquae]|uniref:Putative aromatic aminotransferase n=1 Tax=Gordonia malaquae NBRC 108250 TaxID=1223542 RepID=M3UZ03_GORML|nr:PLP-dependent aminotransferase family protein [Gordonia malaquae]GAC81167.1 putative aromatic aminotransferase [Gordonia malaquae NBRC 108250]SEC02657.1 DNA-binding transcriptional regulator, MocR family, contains an aminotransferase domain [Gordonia malaquae]
MPTFSDRIDGLRPSPIRTVLSVVDRPGMVSFAGGLPAAAALPAWSGSVGPETLQYGASEGEPALRRAVADHLHALGVDTTADRVIILSGSQQGIDLVAKLMIDAGTITAVDDPTYLAALQVLRLYGADFTGLDDTGLADASLAYVVPTFANPTGACASGPERDRIADTCRENGTVLFEDDPYRELAYADVDRTPIVARMHGASWIYQGSFSKTFAPGLRLGFMTASPDLFDRLVMLKQAVDLHSSRLSQQIVLDAITGSGWQDRLDSLVDFYRDRRDGFDELLRTYFADLADWTSPPGGLFFWLRLREPMDTRRLLDEAVGRGVAFMPGEEFYAGPPTLGTMRLNFSHADHDDADRGLRILADLVAERFDRRGS